MDFMVGRNYSSFCELHEGVGLYDCTKTQDRILCDPKVVRGGMDSSVGGHNS